MTAIDDVLRKVRDLDEKATAGPWDWADWSQDDGPDKYTLQAPPSTLPGGPDKVWPDLHNRILSDEDREASEGDRTMIAESRTLLPRVAKALGILAAAMDKLSNGDGYHVRCAAEAALIEAEAVLKGEDRG